MKIFSKIVDILCLIVGLMSFTLALIYPTVIEYWGFAIIFYMFYFHSSMIDIVSNSQNK